MDPVITLPRRSWTERASLALALALVVIGAWALVGWIFHADSMLEPIGRAAPIKANEALCFLAIGLALAGRELGIRRAAWAAVVPALVGGLTSLEGFFGVDLKIDELLARDSLLVDTAQPGRGSVMAACCIALAGATLLLRLSEKRARERLFAEAVSGSILASVGFSALLGYLFRLPAVYDWGTNTAMAAVTATALLATGSAFLVLAWRDSMRNEGGPPAWLPMPAVIGSLTLTLIFWIGLKERENTYLGSKALTAADQLATTIRSDIEQQMNALDRLARDGADSPENNLAAWLTDAVQLYDESKDLGCVNIQFIDPSLKTRWIYPTQGNEGLMGFDHVQDSGRRDAIFAARTKNVPEVVITADVGGKKASGFVIYAPISRAGSPNSYAALEYLYARFFSTIVRQQPELASNYSVVVILGRQEVYRSTLLDDRIDQSLQTEKVYPIYGERIRLGLTPTYLALSRDRRFLPEMALGGGLAITLLLGFTLH